MIQPGFAAIAAKYDQEVAEYIRASPQRAWDFAFAYGGQGENNRPNAATEADHARFEAERRVARAARDTTYALEWAARVVRSKDMDNPFEKMTTREKVDAVQQQEYEVELATYCRNLALLAEIPEPAVGTFPARNRAHREAQRIYAETIGPYVYTPRPKRRPVDGAEPLDSVVAGSLPDSSSSSEKGVRT